MKSTHAPPKVPTTGDRVRSSQESVTPSFMRRAGTVIGLSVLSIVFIWILWQALDIFLLIFGGILLAVFLRALSDGLKKVTHLPDKLSLSIVMILLLAIVAGAAWWLGPRIGSQVSQLGQNLSSAAQQVQDALSQFGINANLTSLLPGVGESQPPGQQPSIGNGIVSRITGVFSRTLEALSYFVIILFVGIFFAFEPGLYMRGVVRLFPHHKRDRICEVLRAEEHTLRWWLIGTLISMTIIGILTGTTLWLLGVPLAFTLGILSGLLEFIPIIGPLLAAIPATLIAFTVSPQTALYVLLIYFGIQFLESNVIMPVVMRQTVKLPPVITLTAQAVLGILAGPVGVLLATPLAAALMVLVQMLYVEDVLHDDMKIEQTQT